MLDLISLEAQEDDGERGNGAQKENIVEVEGTLMEGTQEEKRSTKEERSFS